MCFSVMLGQGDLEDSHLVNVNEDKQALQQDSESRALFEAREALWSEYREE